MGEVITGPFGPDPRRQAAEEHRQRGAAALRSEAEQIRQRLAACRKVPKDDRQKFAVHCYRMFQKLDALENGDVGAILREVTGERHDPSKRRGRFAQLTKLDTPLTARGSQWEERWPLKTGQPVKLFPSMRRTGLDGQGHAQAIHG